MSKLTVVVLAASLASSALATSAPGRLPIVNDDFARARAEAGRRHVPVFVEVWAPW
jgi:hypothetical protein